MYPPIELEGASPEYIEMRQREWKELSIEHGESLIVQVDASHPGKCGLSNLSINHALGISLTGTLVSRTKRGAPDSQSFWHNR